MFLVGLSAMAAGVTGHPGPHSLEFMTFWGPRWETVKQGHMEWVYAPSG